MSLDGGRQLKVAEDQEVMLGVVAVRLLLGHGVKSGSRLVGHAQTSWVEIAEAAGRL